MSDPFSDEFRNQFLAARAAKTIAEKDAAMAKCNELGNFYLNHDTQYSTHYWWVHSLTVPGRYRNLFQ